MSEGTRPRYAAVTGAARGIGRAIARELSARGLGVAVLDKDGSGAQDVAEEIASAGVQALAVEVDLTDSGAADSAVEDIRGAWGSIDVLVNNAGWDEIHPFLDTDVEFWEKILRINLLTVMGMCRAVAPLMIEGGYGRIVNIASDAARVGSSGEAPYSGAKAGVVGFSKALAREVARHGITVNVVCPGPSQTPLLEEMAQKGEEAAKVLTAVSRAIPLGRTAAPEDVAYAVAFFASEEAGYITGQVLSVSGGLTMAG